MVDTTVPINTPSEQPTRRALLGTMGAAGVVGAEDPHMAWHAEAIRRRNLLDGPERPGIDDTAEAEEMFDLERLVAETPAATMAGVREQLRLAHHCAETWKGDRNDPVAAALANALGTLERLGGRA